MAGKNRPKTGGRTKGVPNRATLERAERQRLEMDEAKRSGKKLAKDVLEDYMFAFAALAGIYQNRIAEKVSKGEEPGAGDLDGFERWGKLTATTAKDCAEFQSPKAKAITFYVPPPVPPRLPGDDAKIIDVKDANATARVYRNFLKIGKAG